MKVENAFASWFIHKNVENCEAKFEAISINGKEDELIES